MLTLAQRETVLATQSGLIHPFMLRSYEIRIEDIALALSNIPRYGGHTRPALSVAQHCLDGEYFLRQEGANILARLTFLLHDAGEAYSGDSSAPVLTWFPSVRRFRKRIQQAVYVYFLGAEPDERTQAIVQAMDLQMRALEVRRLFPEWQDKFPDLQVVELPVGAERWRGPIENPRMIEREYLQRFEWLIKEWEDSKCEFLE